LNLLDENFPADQRLFLRTWGIAHRQIGDEIANAGIKDDNIIPLLHRLPRPTFFTGDGDFFSRNLCHSGYCLVWLDAPEDDSAVYVRRFLEHHTFDTERKRLGVVARAHHDGISFWARGRQPLNVEPWD